MGLIGILGASGVYGRHLVPRLVARGHRVRALVRRPEAAGSLAACGAELHRADIFEPATMQAGLAGCDLAINLATGLPMPGARGVDFSANDRLRREGVPNWVQAGRDAGVPRILQQSIALVHAGPAGILTDETTLLPPDLTTVTGQAIDATLQMEATIRRSDLDWVILRGAYFYGPGTGVDVMWMAQARDGKLRMPGDGTDYMSLLHIADMAQATMAAIAVWPNRQALIIADDRPATASEILGHAAALAGGPPPQPGGRGWGRSYRVSNARARHVLGWAPAYPDYRSGLVG